MTKPVISYFMPKYQTLNFSYNLNLKLKIQCEFDEQISIGTQAFWGVYLQLNEEIEHDNTRISDETQITVVVPCSQVKHSTTEPPQ